jgi:hypothetical protein
MPRSLQYLMPNLQLAIHQRLHPIRIVMLKFLRRLLRKCLVGEVYRSGNMKCRVRAEAALDTQGSTPLYSGPFEASSYHLINKLQIPAFLLTGMRLHHES